MGASKTIYFEYMVSKPFKATANTLYQSPKASEESEGDFVDPEMKKYNEVNLGIWKEMHIVIHVNLPHVLCQSPKASEASKGDFVDPEMRKYNEVYLGIWKEMHMIIHVNLPHVLYCGP